MKYRSPHKGLIIDGRCEPVWPSESKGLALLGKRFEPLIFGLHFKPIYSADFIQPPILKIVKYYHSVIGWIAFNLLRDGAQ